MKIYTKPAISILICLAVIAFAACKNGPESSNNENGGAGLNVSESAAEFSGAAGIGHQRIAVDDDGIGIFEQLHVA